MSATENILGAVIGMMVILTLGIVIYHSTTEYIVTEYEFEKEEHLHDLYSSGLNAIMLVTEPSTKKNMASLLADALYYRTETLNFSGKTVNVTEEFTILLDEIYGEGRYYLEIKPRIIDVSLNFVIDGSNSLTDERETLANELSKVMDTIRQEINVTGEEIVISNIYILGDSKRKEDRDKCLVFDPTRKDIICRVITFEDIYFYEALDDMNVSYSSSDASYYKYQYNMTPPFDELVNISKIRKKGLKDFYEADWAFGSAYASANNKGNAKLVLIFPMGDELSTSSIQNNCFEEKNIPKQKMCDICSASCTGNSDTELRSLRQVKKAIAVIKANNHIVNPIFAYTCDYEYKPMFNVYYEIVYGANTNDACSESSCGGCTNSGTGVCFHPECKDSILSQMKLMADETFGKVIDLKEINTLTYNIQDTIEQNLNEYKISVGIEQNHTVRHAISKSIPLPNKLLTDATLIVYPELTEEL